MIEQFPHCDPMVLHAPGVCKYCDMHPDWQQLRDLWGINYTGESLPHRTQCPAEKRRPLAMINRWYGNVATPEIVRCVVAEQNAPGYFCTRGPHHDGPCAAVHVGDVDVLALYEQSDRGMSFGLWLATWARSRR